MKIKAFLLTIVVIFSVFGSTSCSKDREYDETEVITAAKTLIEKSTVLNDIYYGYGIEADLDRVNESNGAYYPANDISLKKFGISTVEDIKTLTRECFSVELSNDIISTKLSSISDEDGILGYARYYQKYDSFDETKEECIMVYKDAKVNLTDNVVYNYESLHVSGVKEEEVFVTITVTVTTPDNKTQSKDIEISLIEEASGWRINSPTYAKYVDLDYYNDLQSK